MNSQPNSSRSGTIRSTERVAPPKWRSWNKTATLTDLLSLGEATAAAADAGPSVRWAALHTIGPVSEPVISVTGLRKSYGDFEAVRGLDLEVRSGEVFAFLGPERRRQDDDS